MPLRRLFELLLVVSVAVLSYAIFATKLLPCIIETCEKAAM